MLSRRSFWSPSHPLWLCGFRPFFSFAIASAASLVGLWVAFLSGGLPLPEVPGGPFLWHAHELLFGFGLAAVAGFLLTAAPEFTGSAPVGAVAVRRLAAAWLCARLAFWLSGTFGTAALAVAGLANLTLLAGLAAVAAPRLWRDPERRHLAFLWVLLALAVLVGGFYVDALRGVSPMRWLHATIGVLMALIVVAMSRISMRIVNGAIDERWGEAATVEYRARPPRRNLAIVCIALYTAAEFAAPGARIGGWLALAAAAALFNLLNDWHVGRALLRRWPLMLYGVYVLMAAGYGAIGLALVADVGNVSAGRHLLTVGALGLNVFVVICIAGRMHCGHPLDERRWVLAGASLLVGASLMRAAAAWAVPGAAGWMALSGLAWAGAFTLCAAYLAPLFVARRTDGRSGCDGWQPE